MASMILSEILPYILPILIVIGIFLAWRYLSNPGNIITDLFSIGKASVNSFISNVSDLGSGIGNLF